MNLSPPWGVGVLEAGIAVVQRDLAVARLVELNCCSRKVEAPVLRRDLEAAAVPLHDVVITNDAFVPEAQMRRRSSGAGRQALAASHGVQAKRRL